MTEPRVPASVVERWAALVNIPGDPDSRFDLARDLLDARSALSAAERRIEELEADVSGAISGRQAEAPLGRVDKLREALAAAERRIEALEALLQDAWNVIYNRLPAEVRVHRERDLPASNVLNRISAALSDVGEQG